MLQNNIQSSSTFINLINSKIVLIVGFALFSMFFGAGNLIFPISIGVLTQDQFVFGGLGLLCTGVMMPLIGLLSVLYSKSDSLIEYFNSLGKVTAFVLTLCILCLLGPCSVLPRSIIVASGASALISPLIPMSILKLIICLIVAILTNTKNNIVDILGRYLTPLLLICITGIIILGNNHVSIIEPSHLSSLSALALGLIEGYQTMDLLAAFTFSLIIIKYIKNKITEPEQNPSFYPIIISACIVCAFLLLITYCGFIFLGAGHYEQLINVDPSQRLVVLAISVLGEYSLPIISLIIILACITTMCALTVIFAEFISKILLLNKKTSILLTITISYLISLIDFTTLSAYLVYILKFFYPALIVYACLKLLQIKFNLQNKAISCSFWIVLVVGIVY